MTRLISILALVLTLSLPGLAQAETEDGYAARVTDKFTRGLVNIVLSPMEIVTNSAADLRESTEQNANFGVRSGATLGGALRGVDRSQSPTGADHGM